jgi:hypothetical protein
MKIRLIRDDLNAPPGTVQEGVVSKNGVLWWLKGTIIDVPKRAAQLLVGNGDAEPADDEAEAACDGWRNRRADVLVSREMLARGIEPQDRERFRAGELAGYNPDGSEIPGPHWRQADEQNSDQ